MAQKIIDEPKGGRHGVAHRGPEHSELKRRTQRAVIKVFEVLKALLYELAVVRSSVLHHSVQQDLSSFVGDTCI